MKKFRIIALITVFALAVCCFAGCEEKKDAANAGGADQAKEKLVMATNAEFPPYEYMESGKIVGIDAEIAQAIADKLGKELVIENVDFDSLIPGVQTKKYDFVMAGMTVTEERLEQVSFTKTYATGIQSVIVKEDSPITSVDDLFKDGANNKVGVQLATTGDIYCTGDIEDAGLGSIERFNKGADAVMALTSGKIDCVVIDNEPAKVFVENNEGLKILDTEYIEEEYAAAVSKENPELLAQIDKALSELIEDGTVAKIVEKYIPAE